MTDDRSAAEARLLHVERGLEVMARDVREDQRALIALGQGIWAEWSNAAALGAVTTMPTTFSGTVDGCTGGLSGITVVATDHATSAVLATVTSGAGGAFSGTVTITGTVSVDFTASATNFVTTTTNTMMTAGTSTSGIFIGLTAATGYICAPGCNEPVNKTLTVVDSNFGTFTATYTGTFSGQLTWQTSGVTVNYTGDGSVPCAAVAVLPVTYILTNGGSWVSKAQYISVSLFNACPATSGSSATSTHTLSSVACPPGFSAGFINAAAQRLYSHAAAGTYAITWTG